MIENLGSQKELSDLAKLKIIWNQQPIHGIPAKLLCALWVAMYAATLGSGFGAVFYAASNIATAFVIPVLCSSLCLGLLTKALRFNSDVKLAIDGEPPVSRYISSRTVRSFGLSCTAPPRNTILKPRHAPSNRRSAAPRTAAYRSRA